MKIFSFKKIINIILNLVIFLSFVAIFQNYNVMSLLNKENPQRNKLYISTYDLYNNGEIKEMDQTTIDKIEQLRAVSSVYPFYFIDLEAEDVTFTFNGVRVQDVAKQYMIAYYPEDNLDDKLKKVFIDVQYADLHQLVHSDDGKEFIWLGDVELSINKGNQKYDFIINDYTNEFKFMIPSTTNIISVPYTQCANLIDNHGVYVIYTDGTNIIDDLENIDSELYIYNFSDNVLQDTVKSQVITKLIIYSFVFIGAIVGKIIIKKAS